MDFLQVTKARKKYLRFPASVYEQLESKHYFMPVGETDDHDTWVTARFSPHRRQEHILFMGDDPGNIGIFDVRKFHDRAVPLEERQIHFFPAHEGAIMDIVGVPQKESQIVSISGDSTIRCWDLTNTGRDRSSQMFFGHEGSVRSICFAPNDPNVFVTGARDAQVKTWDMRISAVKKNEEECRMATLTYKNAHPSSQTEKPTPGTPKSKGKVKYVGASVTSVIYLDEHHVATASSCAESGVRVWDTRKPTRNGEGQPIRVLRVPTTRQRSFGVTCLAVDRFANRMFASCTNSAIFEFAIQTNNTAPINTYTGATIRDYYTQVACSPVSDVIACGSEDSRALIWDLQDQYSYINDLSLADEIDRRRTLLPRYSCGGHARKVQNVGWSAEGRYFLSFDEGGIRIWTEPLNRRPWQCCDEEVVLPNPQDLGITYEPIKLYEMTESDAASSCLDSISISPRQRLNSGALLSPQKSRGPKRPVPLSPFKSSPKLLRLNRSPRAKMNKPSCSGDSPLRPSNSNVTDDESMHTPRGHKKQFTKRKNPFYYKHPTENLPNLVYDKFVRQMIGEKDSESDEEPVEPKSLSKTSRKRIDDWWQAKTTAENVSTATRSRLPSVSEFGESVCSKVLSEPERIALQSPRKLAIKTSSTATTPISSVSSSLLVQKSAQQRPRKPLDQKPTRRNLNFYFQKVSP